MKHIYVQLWLDGPVVGFNCWTMVGCILVVDVFFWLCFWKSV